MKQNNRKIMKIGGYTRIVSLPLFWLALVGLDAGDYVELSLGKKNELVIKPKRVRNETKTH